MVITDKYCFTKLMLKLAQFTNMGNYIAKYILDGTCVMGHHSFKNKIAFYEAIPFLFHLSSRFAENNLNFMQRQLQGRGVSFLSHKQAWQPLCFSAALSPWALDCLEPRARVLAPNNRGIGLPQIYEYFVELSFSFTFPK